ncbi:hypothetical protein [Streptomyces sp. NPDC017940]
MVNEIGFISSSAASASCVGVAGVAGVAFARRGVRAGVAVA